MGAEEPGGLIAFGLASEISQLFLFRSPPGPSQERALRSLVG